ncbi:MAG: hypothetical protein Q9217_001442 [Psora testacea]
MAIVGFITTSIIISLIVLASHIHHLEPATSWTDVSNKISCDLVTGDAGSVQNALTINLRGAAKLTFTEAKTIDVFWQLMVGGGGRYLMGWITYKSFMDGLVRLMEQSPVSYNLHASMTFSTTSLLAIWQALKAVFTLKGWKGKCFLIWFTISTTYILGFETIISATAGYVQPSRAGFQMADGNFVDGNSDLLTSCFNVTKGGLLKMTPHMTNGTVVPGPAVKDYDVVRHHAILGIPRVGTEGAPFTADFNKTFPEFADLLNSAMSNPYPDKERSGEDRYYITDYTTNFTFMGHTYIFTNYSFVFGVDYVVQYCYNNHSMDGQALKDMAQCITEPYFVWGFSSLLVKIVLAFQIVWVFGTFVVWLDANLHSELCRYGRKLRGPFRATEDLSAAIKELLGEETCAYSDEQLAKELSRHPGLRYYSTDVKDKELSHIGLSSVTLRNVKLDSSTLYGVASGRER